MLPEGMPEDHINYLNYYKNRDKDSSVTPEKNHFTNKQVIATLAGIAVLAVIGGYTANKIFNKNQANTEISTAPAETNPSVITSTPENSTDQYAAAMEKYKEMSVDDFEKLKLDERLLYSQYLVNKTISGGAYEKMYGEGKMGHDFEIKYTPVSGKNNGQEIVNNYLYLSQISALQSTNYVQIVNGTEKTYDTPAGQKILSSIYYTVGNNIASNSYRGVKSVEENLDAPTYENSKYTATNTSELTSGIDDNREAIQYKIVTFYTDSAETLYAKFVYHEFTNYDSTRKAIWLFENQSDKLENLGK